MISVVFPRESILIKLHDQTRQGCHNECYIQQLLKMMDGGNTIIVKIVSSDASGQMITCI